MVRKPTRKAPLLLSELFEKHGLMSRSVFYPEKLTESSLIEVSHQIPTMESLDMSARYILVPLLSSIFQQQQVIKKQSRLLRQGQVERAQLEIKNKDLTEKAYTDPLTKAYTDPLTKAYNRLYFTEKLEEEVKLFHSRRRKSNNQTSAVVFVDLRKFKPINDIYGHEAGDMALKEVTNTLKNILRNEDIVARWGGDEFVILIKDIDAIDSQKVFKRIEKALDDIEFEYYGQKISFSARLGKVKIQENKKPEEIMHEADMMMINSKDPRDRLGGVTEIEAIASLSGP